MYTCALYIGTGKMHNDVLRTYGSSLALYASPPIPPGRIGIDWLSRISISFFGQKIDRTDGAAAGLC